MAFNIMDLFSQTALNRLLQPTQNANGVQNFLANPRAAAEFDPARFGGNDRLPAVGMDALRERMGGQPVNVAAAPAADPWAGMREQDVVSLDPVATGASQPAAGVTPGSMAPTKAKTPWFNDDKRAMLNDFFVGLAVGKDPAQSLGMGALNVRNRNLQRKGFNQTVEWLKSRGVDEGEAKVLTEEAQGGNSAPLNAYIKQLTIGQDPAQQLDMEYKRAQIDNLRNQGAGGPADLGLNPQYGLDAQGNPVLLQLGKDGKVVQSQMPDGVSLSKEPIRLDAGTHFVLLDPITRQPVGQIPKENFQESFDKAQGGEQGKQQGEAVAGLPAAIKNAEYATSVIDQAINHPGREIFTGASSTWDPRNYLRGTDAADYEALHKQIEGQTFLEAFESLKGAGQITEVEGQKATQAKARLERAQSDEAYLAALKELKEVINTGLERARTKAGQPSTTAAPPPATSGGAPGGVVDYRDYFGGQ